MSPMLVLIVIICSFWAIVFAQFRRSGQKISINLMILPAFFALIGIVANHLWPPWRGTIIIGIIHAVLLVFLLVRTGGPRE